jgi:transposase-like protein
MSSLTIEQMAADLDKWRKNKRNGLSHYPEELKKKVLSFQEHYPLTELSRHLNIPTNTLANWIFQAQKTIQKKPLTTDTNTQSFVELTPIILPAHRIILKHGIYF